MVDHSFSGSNLSWMPHLLVPSPVPKDSSSQRALVQMLGYLAPKFMSFRVICKFPSCLSDPVSLAIQVWPWDWISCWMKWGLEIPDSCGSL